MLSSAYLHVLNVCIGTSAPLLKKVLEALKYSKLTSVPDALKVLYKFLREMSPEFRKACSTAVKEGVKLALKYLQTVLDKIVELCKKNKALITQLSKLAVKGVARAGAVVTGTGLKVAMKFGAGGVTVAISKRLGVEKIVLQSVKMALNYTNPAGLVVDVAQVGLEVTGHREIGEQVGKWGNIGIGAVAGAALGGPVGAPIGALVGLGTWLIGEAAALQNRKYEFRT